MTEPFKTSQSYFLGSCVPDDRTAAERFFILVPASIADNLR